MKELLFKKMLIKNSEKILILDIPKDIKDNFIDYRVDFEEKNKEYDRILIFVFDNLEALNPLINKYKKLLSSKGRFYFVYPKKTSKKYEHLKRILTRDNMADKVFENNWRVVTLYYLDDDWTVMRIIPLEIN